MIHGLPQKLKMLRERQGLSQRQIANKVGVSPSIISGYETGERTPSTEALLALSYVYNCSTDYLLGRQASPPSATLDVSGLDSAQLAALKTIVDSLTKK